MINSRNLNDLLPQVKILAEKLITGCKNQDIDLIITSTYRDNASQSSLYQVGRTTMGANSSKKLPMGQIVTCAKAGESFHNYKVAFDVVPVVNGKAEWGNNGLWKTIGKIGTDLGLEWAGNWTSFKEFPHFQFTNGLSIKDFQSGKTI